MRGAAVEMLALSDAPTSFQRVLADRKARVDRETNDPSTQIIACPGGCGGEALLERPLTVTRDGISRTVQMAECQGSCRTEVATRYSRRPRMVRTRFDLPYVPSLKTISVPTPVLEDETVSRPTSAHLAQRLSAAIARAKVNQSEAGLRIGCSQSSVSKMLHGTSVAESTSSAALAWADIVLNAPEEEQAPEPQEAQAETGQTRTQQPQAGPQQPQAGTQEPQAGPGETRSQEPQAPLGQEPLQAVTSLDQSLPVEVSAASTGEEQSMPHSYTKTNGTYVNGGSTNGAGKPLAPTPYEAVLRKLLEEVAQKRLEELAGPAAEGIVARVVLEWADPNDPRKP